VSLTSADFQMTPTTLWQSEKTKARYPIGWRIVVPREQLAFTLRPVMPNQELALDPLIYWEGAFDLDGTRSGQPLRGHGYLELTGYAAPLQELNR
jgi:predicted secreted hydrolase